MPSLANDLSAGPRPGTLPVVTETASPQRLAAVLERLLPTLWSHFTPLPPEGMGELPVAQARVLAHLARDGARRVGELAEDLGVRVPTVTGIVDRLEERGLVERRRSPEDGRAVLVAALPAGERLAAQVRALRERAICDRLQHLDAEERAALLDALRLLERTLSAPEPARATA